jgi:hypothetical protein
VAGKPRRPLWRRRYTSFRHGERPRPDANDDLQRLTLYLTGHLLTLAETLTVRSGAGSVQAYCEQVLIRGLRTEQSNLQIENAEARQGPFEGLREISEDPEYLAEWNASIMHRDENPGSTIDAESYTPFALSAETVMPPPRPESEPEPAHPPGFETVLRHAGLGHEDPLGFLPSLRRGEIPSSDTVEELGAALVDLDRSLKGAASIDRRLAHALHRLAFESQVLHTDAWPDALDTWTIDAIRAVQSAVDRILSGVPSSY